MGILLLIIHVLACTGLILIVLLQAGKGASLGAAFGGGASQTVFGARSATFIGRLTWVLAAVFMTTSLLLAIISPWGDQTAVPQSDILQEEAVPPSPLQGVPIETFSGDVTPPAEPGAESVPQPPEQPAAGTQPAPAQAEE
ncbi:MAG: preprotein translocase subunit SecG [Candidatus Abyssobacteria bacterium SURF_5]|uniref:Protein-export membrane protein SecG n=1 Tax=Abyssobacteria bacterium (strain SURF_5) TaxID=2093360 RepID=A0A3A4NV54_ABYX5|nr:MAG: preprotein translocase subunit SecG [Candidatus Abyssubacteria bacterium SURF_5]